MAKTILFVIETLLYLTVPFVESRVDEAGGGRRACTNSDHCANSEAHCDIDRFDTLSVNTFLQNYYEQKPVLFKSANNEVQRKFVKNALLRDYRDVVLRLRKSASVVSRKVTKPSDELLMPLHEYLGKFRYDPFQNSFIVFDDFLIDKMPKIKEVLRDPVIEGRDVFQNWSGNEPWNTRRHILSLGRDGSGLPFHWHTQVWADLLMGYKKWHLYGPGHLPAQGYHPSEPHNIWEDQVLPNLTKSEKPITCVQNPGEVLYLPEGWYHATINMGDTLAYIRQAHHMSLNRTFVSHFKEYQRSMNSMQYEEAKAHLQAAISHTADHILYLHLARLESRHILGDVSNAANAYTSAIEKNRRRPEPYIELGELMLAADVPHLALDLFSKAKYSGAEHTMIDRLRLAAELQLEQNLEEEEEKPYLVKQHQKRKSSKKKKKRSRKKKKKKRKKKYSSSSSD